MPLRRIRQIWQAWLKRGQVAPDEGDEPDDDLGYGKQALRIILGRKRRSDLVRRIEFDRLRQLRRRGSEAAAAPAEAAFALTASALSEDPLEREETLQKIDAIEAQMARQWWRSGGALAHGAARPVPDSTLLPEAVADLTQAPMTLAPHALAGGQTAADEADTLLPTQPGQDALIDDDVPTLIEGQSRFLDPSQWTRMAAALHSLPLQEAALQWAKADGLAARAVLQAACSDPNSDAPVVELCQRALQELDSAELAEAGSGLVLQGDIQSFCETAARAHDEGRRLVLSCADWLRLDFAAAGSVLNWVQAQRAVGVQLEFHQLRPLVAVFLDLLGLADSARLDVQT